MTETYTIQDISEKLKIHANTIRKWESELNLDIPRDNKNYRRYDDNLVAILEQIKNLREGENGFKTIRRKLQLSSCNQSVELTGNLISTMRNELNAIITGNNQLSIAYGEGQRRIGQLESENKSLKEKIKLLPEPDETNQMKMENSLLKEKLKEAQEKINYLSQPWWKKILKNPAK